MPYCPKCLEEYEEGMSACAECGSDLIDGDLDGDGVDIPGDFEPVFVGPVLEALEIKSMLEDEGFDVFVAGENEGHVDPESVNPASNFVKVLVPEESAQAASELVDNFNGTGDDDTEPAASKIGLPFGEGFLVPDDEASPGFRDDEPSDADLDAEDEPTPEDLEEAGRQALADLVGFDFTADAPREDVPEPAEPAKKGAKKPVKKPAKKKKAPARKKNASAKKATPKKKAAGKKKSPAKKKSPGKKSGGRRD